MNAPLSKKLNEVKWGEFKIGDLFEILSYKKRFDANKVQLEKQGHPYIVRTALNNGLKGFLNEDEKYLNDGNTISFGQDTATMFYQEKPYFTGDKIKILKPKYSRFGKANALFFITEMTKSFSNFSWGSTSFSVDTISDQQVSLPITPENKIDFDFMEAFIRELEEERIRELAAYLKVSGFDNYKLSKCESEALAHFNELKWKEFSYSEIFNHIKQGRRLKKGEQKPGKIPFVMAGTTNTGIVGYISNPIATFPKNSITIDIFGNTFYRNYDFGAGDDTGVYWNDDKNYSSEQMLYFSSCMEKSIRGKFSFGKKLRSSQSFNFRIFLPVTSDDSPDYAFMETFISAVQKLVIKDVVLYADKKIAATKQAVHKNPSDYKTPEGFGTLEVAEHN